MQQIIFFFFGRWECDFNFETDFLENGNLFQKTGVQLFCWKNYNWKRIISIQKLPYQKPILRQIALFFSLETSYKDLIWCMKNPNPHVHTFCKRWSFSWPCFFPVSILKNLKLFSNYHWSNLQSNKEIQGLQAFAFRAVTVDDEHTKSRLKRKLRV